MDLPTEDAHAAAVAKSMTRCLRFRSMQPREREGAGSYFFLRLAILCLNASISVFEAFL